jgi:glucose 1-dehydrogenase
MRAITVVPGADSSADLIEVEDPRRADGELLVEALALGICGTDREIVSGEYGWAPPGEVRLVLGHESLGRVVEAPNGSGFNAGDLVAGMVRRPDPVPCPCCAAGEPDMCRNGRYQERGIKELHGYGSERWVIEPQYAVRLEPGLESVGILVEPTSVVAKAWEQIERIGDRACLPLERVLVTGAGPIGLLAALLATERGLDVHVLDQLEGGPKAALAEALGGRYHSSSVSEMGGELGADIIVECTGVAELVVDAMQQSAPGAIVCLTGVSPTGRALSVDVGSLNNELVLENDVVFGSVNANRRHYETAAAALARADRGWLEAMVTRRVPLESWEEALDRGPDDVKTVIQFGE